MPFDATNKVVYGPDARSVPQWARTRFCIWLAAKLNDPAGHYAGPLGITEERQAIVSDNRLESRAAYSDAKSPPVVFVEQGPINTSSSGKSIEGVAYRGTRYELVLNLDMGIKDKEPDDDDETAKVRDDSLLVSFLADVIERSFIELGSLGLSNARIKADEEKQRAGEGRYPHRLTCFALGLNDWTPD